MLGIGKGDKDQMHAQHQRNYRFFDAPVGLMFTVDKVMGRGSLVDYGAFLQNIMVAARGRGLDTCAQAAWNGFASIILPHIGAGEAEMLICGMSLGYAERSAPVNDFHTPPVCLAAGNLRPRGSVKKRLWRWCWACIWSLSPFPMPSKPYRPQPFSRRRSI